MTDDIRQKLEKQPWSFRFFQAVYLLQGLTPGRDPVGGFSRPDKEAVRFRVNNSLGFPASEIQNIEWNDGEAPCLSVNFMGLTGPSSILPIAYTEFIADRARSKDHALAAFLDIFNHRMISLFYAAWEKHRFLLRYEEQDGLRGFSGYLAALCGIGGEGLLQRLPIEDETLLYYAGLLSSGSRSAAALQNLLVDYFDVPVEIEEFVGAWYKLDADNQCCFLENGSYSERLGLGVIVGDEIWSQQSRVRIRIGPLTWQEYRDFLPAGTAYPALRALTRFFKGNEVDFEVQLVLRRDEVPACKLGDGEQVELGWGAWIKTTPDFERDPDETVFLLN